jgi:cell division septation protein DedD
LDGGGVTLQRVVKAAVEIAIVLLAMVSAGAQPAGGSPIAEPSEEDLRILEVTLEDTVLSDGLVAFAGPSGGTLLPLQALSEVLALAITAKPEEGQATGFLLNERRTFHLDVARRQVTLEGRQQTFDPSLVRVHRDDIYVDSALLGEWLPVAFDVDLFALRVRIRPREPLPVQLRMERERRIRHWRLMLPQADPGYLRQRTPYRAWDTPFIDQTLRLSFGERSTASFATYATGDLLFMESEAYLAGGDEDFFDAARLTLRRRDPTASMGGWLGATEVAVGHVIHPSSGLLSVNSEPLPGFLLTNLPLNRPIEFDRHDFRGNLPPGWDVELYHNGALIDYQQSRADGQYLFENVSVLFGMNFFRLVFYGPQGQQRVEEHRFLLGESLTLPGRFEYRVTGNVESENRRRLSALGSYGISRHLTATAETSFLPTLTGQRRYGKGGLRAFWSALFTYGDLAFDDQGGRAWEAGLQTRVLGTNLLVSRQSLSGGFVSEAFSHPGDPLRERDRLRLDAAIPAWILPRIPVTVEVERQRFTSGLTRTTAQSRLSARYKGMAFTNRALWAAVSGQPSHFEGGLQVSRYIGRVGIRGELLYTLAPVSFTTANITLERSLRSGYRLHANVSRSLIGTSHIYSVGVDKTTGSFAAGLNATRDGLGNTTANVDVSAGIGREPREGEWMANAHSRAAYGAISARVFLDRDENGQFDAGDEPLPRVGFTINGVERQERTGDSGIAFISEVSPHIAADVAVDTRTLDDPQWVAVRPGLRITPRPGKSATIEIPVLATAEIEGTVETARAGSRKGVGGVTVELLNAAGEVVQQTATAYDGFYVLSHVRRGAYRVRVALQSLNLPVSTRADALEKPVTVSPSRSVVTGVDFLLPRGEEPPPSPSPAAAVAGIRPRDTSSVEIVPKPAPPPAATAQEERLYIVQLGSFSIAANARRLALSVRDIAADTTVVSQGSYSVVRTGRRTEREAAALTRELKQHGINAMVIPAVGSRFPAGRADREFVVQLGAFRSSRNAFDLARRIMGTVKKWRAIVDHRGGLYFVETPPFATRAAAAAARETLHQLGFAAIVRESEGP